MASARLYKTNTQVSTVFLYIQKRLCVCIDTAMKWIVSLPKFTCESPTPSVTVFGDKAFKEMIKVKRGPNSGPYSNRTGTLRRRERHQIWHTHRKGHVRTQKTMSTHHRVPQEEPALLTPWSQTSSFQDCEKQILFKPLGLWYSDMAALAGKCRH